MSRSGNGDHLADFEYPDTSQWCAHVFFSRIGFRFIIVPGVALV